MITSEKSGVWELDDIYNKNKAGYLSYSDSGLFAWGANGTGSLGQNDRVNRSSPIQIPGGNWLISSISRRDVFSIGSGFSSLIKTDGTLWTWGRNYSGQLGLNNNTYQSSPVQIPGTQWNKISSTGFGIWGIKTDSTLWSWGRNISSRPLGLNDLVDRSSPTQIPGTQWNNVKCGDNAAFFSKTDGTLWGVGSGAGLGLNGTVQRSSPHQIPGTQWNSNNFDSHYNGALALKTDSTLWAWGYNSNGIVAANTNITYYSSPTQIPGTQWSSIAEVGRQATAVFKTDGTLWVWGYNDYGSLGLNQTTSGGYSSPTQLPGTQWDQVSLGDSWAKFKKTDGTLWGSGRNDTGELGLNDTVWRSSPTQIPGTQWKLISNMSENAGHSVALKES